MNFKTGKIKDFYLLTTEVENIFISEYMPQAPGEYVKVYMYALLYAAQGIELTHEGLSRQLGLSQDELDRAWNYWADMGAIKKTAHDSRLSELSNPGYDVEFLSLRELMYAPMSEASAVGSGAMLVPEAAATNFDDVASLHRSAVREIFDFAESLKGKPLSEKEMRLLSHWYEHEGIDKDLIQRAIEHCFERNKTSIRYLETVIMEWNRLGIKTAREADEYIESISEKYAQYKKILNALGIMGRTATDGEKKIIDRWLGEMGFTLERVLEACAKTVGIANPNVNYVNKILENWKKDADVYGRSVNQKTAVNQAVLNSYYEYLRQDAEEKARERKREVYAALPRVKETDDSLRELGSKLSQAVLGGAEKDKLAEMKRLTTLLEQERAVLLTENNFSVDYTDVKYLCSECSDTGIDESGRRCSCAKKRIGEAELWLNSKTKK